jgi:hypothetical protein
VHWNSRPREACQTSRNTVVTNDESGRARAEPMLLTALSWPPRATRMELQKPVAPSRSPPFPPVTGRGRER